VTRDGLPPGWEQPIPESIWPDALISAVRSDISVLATPRVIETIKKWRDENKRGNRDARERLRQLGTALAGDGASPRLASFDQVETSLPDSDPSVASLSEVNDVFTADSFALPPPVDRKRPRFAAMPQQRIGSNETSGFIEASDAIVNVNDAPQIAEEDEKPTTLRLPEAVLEKRPKFYRAARSDPMSDAFSEEDDKPTASIPIPQIPSEDTKELGEPPQPAAPQTTPPPVPPNSRVGPRLMLRDDDLEDSEDSLVEPREEATVAADKAPVLPPPLPPPLPLVDVEESKGQGRLAPKPGIVRRRALSAPRKESPARPRAAMQQVRTLYAVVSPLCEELIPLSVERRSRRFWARWREVAGDRGVRREFVEDLLQSAHDVRTLACELIAEVQTVDVKSVYALVDRIESGDKAHVSGPIAAVKPVVPPERQRGPLVGASVRVEGVQNNEED
jgi:hypothetical protein